MCFFSSDSSPKPPPPPPITTPPPPPPRVPQKPNPVKAGENTAQLSAANSRGRRGTILTGGRGDLKPAETDKKTLLGY
jgi:hypothetical protein